MTWWGGCLPAPFQVLIPHKNLQHHSSRVRAQSGGCRQARAFSPASAGESVVLPALPRLIDEQFSNDRASRFSPRVFSASSHRPLPSPASSTTPFGERRALHCCRMSVPPAIASGPASEAVITCLNLFDSFSAMAYLDGSCRRLTRLKPPK